MSRYVLVHESFEHLHDHLKAPKIKKGSKKKRLQNYVYIYIYKSENCSANISLLKNVKQIYQKHRWCTVLTMKRACPCICYHHQSVDEFKRNEPCTGHWEFSVGLGETCDVQTHISHDPEKSLHILIIAPSLVWLQDLRHVLHRCQVPSFMPHTQYLQHKYLLTMQILTSRLNALTVQGGVRFTRPI